MNNDTIRRAACRCPGGLPGVSHLERRSGEPRHCPARPGPGPERSADYQRDHGAALRAAGAAGRARPGVAFGPSDQRTVYYRNLHTWNEQVSYPGKKSYLERTVFIPENKFHLQ
eukprot:1193735-Prorocentrum_minimum.AAC.1